jgi:hypothetical protein
MLDTRRVSSRLAYRKTHVFPRPPWDLYPTLDALDLIPCKRCVCHLPSSHRRFTVLLSVSPTAPSLVRCVASFSSSSFWNHHNTQQNTSTPMHPKPIALIIYKKGFPFLNPIPLLDSDSFGL